MSDIFKKAKQEREFHTQNFHGRFVDAMIREHERLQSENADLRRKLEDCKMKDFIQESTLNYAVAHDEGLILQLANANQIIKDLVYQHCEQVIIDGQEETDHGWLSANETAFRYMLQAGLAKPGGTEARIIFVEDKMEPTEREKIEQIIIESLQKESEIELEEDDEKEND